MMEKFVPGFEEVSGVSEPVNQAALEQTAGVSRIDPRLALTEYRDSAGYLLVKRIFDIALSAVAFAVLFPFMLMIAAIIYIDDPHGSPIYVSDRVGKDGKHFRFLKFRSMVVDAEARLKDLQDQNEMDGPVFKISKDPRVTKFGRFIRKSSIDELPQLANIIKGEMSIVGPRPPLPNEVAQYTPYEMQRLLVKPGLTCYWQARGRNNISFDEWMKLDMKYVYQHNLWIDLKLIVLTLRSVVTGKGAM